MRSEDNAADLLTKPMKNADSFFKWRAIIMNEPARVDDTIRVADDKHQAADRAQPARVPSSRVEPAPRTGTLVRGGASESGGSSAHYASNVTCACCTSPFSLTRDKR